MRVADRMQRSVVTIGREDSLALAVQVMGWNGIRHLPVVDSGRVVGVLSERDLLRRAEGGLRGHIEGHVADAMSAPAKTVPSSLSLEEAAAILVASRIGALPVVDLGELTGILTTTDVLGYTAQCAVSAPEREPRVSDVMTRSVEAVFLDDSLVDAAARMRQRAVRHLPVVDGEHRVIGLLSEQEVTQLTGAELLELGWGRRAAWVDRLRVAEAMDPSPRTIGSDEPIDHAVKALVEERVGALPVVDGQDVLQGMVSYVDLLGFLGAGA